MITGCGILPITIKNNKLLVLCGIENNGKLSDLGGRIEPGETAIQCATREFYEESVGLVARYEDLLNYRIYHKVVLQFHGKSYISYVIKMKYIDVQEKYQKLLEYVKEHNSQAKKINFKDYNMNQLYKENIYPSGYFELKDIKWIPLEDLEIMVKNKSKIMNYRLRNIIYRLLL